MKVLHIDGSGTPTHVSSIIELLNAAGVEQCTLNHIDNVKYPPNIHKYVFPFKKNTFIRVGSKKYVEMSKFIANVINVEKPDLIHSYNPFNSIFAMSLALKYSGSPGIIHLWGQNDLVPSGDVHAEVVNCLKSSVFAASDMHIKFVKEANRLYHTNKDFVRILPPIFFEFYDRSPVKLDAPRILLSRTLDRAYIRTLLCPALRTFLIKNKYIRLTVLYKDTTIDIYNKFFADLKNVTKQPLCDRYAFSKVIQNNNIVVSITQDSGASATTLQSMYCGNVTIEATHKISSLTDNNCVLSDIDTNKFYNKLVYAVDNYKSLSAKFYKNNKFVYNSLNTVKLFSNLLSYYKTLFPKFDSGAAEQLLSAYYKKMVSDFMCGNVS